MSKLRTIFNSHAIFDSHLRYGSQMQGFLNIGNDWGGEGREGGGIGNSAEGGFRRSKGFCKIHRKTPVLESFVNKIADLTDSNFIKKRLQHRYFPVNIAKFLRTAFFTEQFRSCFCTLRTTVPGNYSEETRRNIITISFLIIIWDLQLKQITIHEDHNIQTRKPLLLVAYRNQVFLYFDF